MAEHKPLILYFIQQICFSHIAKGVKLRFKNEYFTFECQYHKGNLGECFAEKKELLDLY